MKTIVLGRHAKSDWSLGLPDFDRPLNGRGKKDAPRMGKLLDRFGFMPDLIISSPAMRAKTTAKIVGDQLNYVRPIQLEQCIYDEGHGAIYNLIQSVDDAHSTIMLFGHNPIMENLAAFMLQMQAGIIMPTCGMICIEAPTYSWKNINPLNNSMKWFIIPKLVKHSEE